MGRQQRSTHGDLARVALRPLVFTGLMLCGLGVYAAAPDDPDSSLKPRTSELGSAQLEQVVVTGSRLRAAQTQSAQELLIYDRERIERSGQTTLNDFLATLPEVSLNTVESANLSTTVRVRGATRGSTLVLINGRRAQPVTGGSASFGYFDLNMVPLSLIDRIEILPNGSSAIYGGDALAGVVNVVLRQDFTGAEASAGYKWAKNTDEQVYDAGVGWKAGPFSGTIMANYSSRTSLLGKDREITASPDYRRFGGPNLGTPDFGAPGTVFSVSGNLPGVNATFAAIPAGSSGVGLHPSDFAATGGIQNTGTSTRYTALVRDAYRSGFFASGSYKMTSSLEIFAELLASRYKLVGPTAPPSLQLATVPASNAFNPFGTTVRFSGVIQGAEPLSVLSYDEEFVRPLFGARGQIGLWDWELAALLSRDNGAVLVQGQPNTARLNAALASPNPTTALNPFVDGPMASPDLLASIYSNSTLTTYKGDGRTVNGFLRGPVMKLPAGTLDAVVGAEFEKSTLHRDFAADRTAKAAFGELRIPVVELLSLQAATRYDNYSDFGSKTTWQAGLEARPVKSLLLRGTHATAFRPPTLFNVASPLTAGPTPVTDPRRGGETVTVQQISGGNPDLSPTSGTSSTLGFVWSPQAIRGFNVNVTGWKLDMNNAINLPSTQFIVTNESLYPERVVRGPAPAGQAGPITTVDRTYINFGTMRQQGIDASVDWRGETAVGTLSPALAAVYMSKFEGTSTPGSPVVDRLSRANSDGIFAPRWKGTASVGWQSDSAFKLWLAGRYIGRYYDFTPPRTIGNVWYFDATLEVGIERLTGVQKGSLGGLKLLVSGINLADKLPPYSTFFRGYDVNNYDLVGRTIFVRLLVNS